VPNSVRGIGTDALYGTAYLTLEPTLQSSSAPISDSRHVKRENRLDQVNSLSVSLGEVG